MHEDGYGDMRSANVDIGVAKDIVKAFIIERHGAGTSCRNSIPYHGCVDMCSVLH